jgi:DNA-binding transcriptional LysR family regulator
MAAVLGSAIPRHGYNPGMNVDLRELEIFCAVVERESFTKAAEQVHLAQASVSERIAKLERSVGAELLHRSSRTVTPTVIGQRLYDGAKRLLAEHRGLVNGLADLVGLRDGELTIGASTIPGEYLLPGWLAVFRAAVPGILVRVLIGGSREIATRVAAGELEVGVVSSGIAHRELEATPIWRDELVVVAPAGHRWSGRTDITFEDLAGEPVVLREPGSGTRGAFESAIAAHLGSGLGSLQIAAELGSTTAVKEAVLGGLGVGIMSTRAIVREIEHGSATAVKLEGVDLTRSIDCVAHRRRALSPAGRSCVEHLVAVAEL